MKKAEYDGHIKYLGYFDGWIHKENGCNGILTTNGKPGHFECYACGATFKKQPMLASQVEIRLERAKDLISTVQLELRDDKKGLIRFIVRSQSCLCLACAEGRQARPKAYLVYRDVHGWCCPCEDFRKHCKYELWRCKHIFACQRHHAR